jgi:DNA-binding LacI/PurR family transcriptional regulator
MDSVEAARSATEVAGARVGIGSTRGKDPRQVVMADVARLAGVSHQTVSRVLNDPRSVKAETRRRVAAAIRELDYRPNTAARALASGRSRSIGVVSFDTRLYGPASTLHAIQQAAQDAGYSVNIVSLNSLDRGPVLDAVGRLRNQAVDGIIIIAPVVTAAQALLEIPPEVPAVAVEGLMHAPIPVVAVNQYMGAARATQHLLDLGHRTVWHIAGPSEWFEARARQDGWRSTLEAAGAPVPPVLAGDWSPRSGYEQGKRLVAGDNEVTAVFVANDQMALGVLRAMHEVDLEVPDDISIVGFDDIPEASYFPPPLTTVRQEFSEVGTRAMALLLSQLRGEPSEPLEIVVDADLVVRASTAPPR